MYSGHLGTDKNLMSGESSINVSCHVGHVPSVLNTDVFTFQQVGIEKVSLHLKT